VCQGDEREQGDVSGAFRVRVRVSMRGNPSAFLKAYDDLVAHRFTRRLLAGGAVLVFAFG